MRYRYLVHFRHGIWVFTNFSYGIAELGAPQCPPRLALTWVSFRDFPLRYEMRGGSWKMFRRYGWFCIRCHFPMSMFLWLGNAGWYCVTKGRIFSRAFLYLCSSAFFLSASPQKSFWARSSHSKRRLRGGRWVTRIEIRVFECLYRLEVYSNVKDRILVESECPRM